MRTLPTTGDRVSPTGRTERETRYDPARTALPARRKRPPLSPSAAQADVVPRELGGGRGRKPGHSREAGQSGAGRPCAVWRSLVSPARRQLLRLPVRSPPAPTMFSALARPAGAALRRSFSTSAQVGPTRGCLQAEAPRPGPRGFWAREQP